MKTKTFRERRACRCVHFTGVQNKQCKAGVTYPKGPLPCFRDEMPHSEAACEPRRWPTEAELDADEARHKASMERMEKALAAVAPIRKEQKGKNWQGVIVCPVCQGKLHVSHAAYNGHVHGKCETTGCVAWME